MVSCSLEAYNHKTTGHLSTFLLPKWDDLSDNNIPGKFQCLIIVTFHVYFIVLEIKSYFLQMREVKNGSFMDSMTLTGASEVAQQVKHRPLSLSLIPSLIHTVGELIPANCPL